jgi:quinol monooxygenase YgiN
MLVVLAEARFDPKDTERVREVTRPMIEASRAEPGCGGYDYAFDLLEPDLMRVRELWKDEQALKDHFATPHMAAFLTDLRALRPKTLTVKCYELGPEKKMPGAGEDARSHPAYCPVSGRALGAVRGSRPWPSVRRGCGRTP